MSKPKPGKTAPKNGTFLAWGKPKSTRLVQFVKPGWHTAYWDGIDQSYCLSGATFEGPFIKPKYWLPLPNSPQVTKAMRHD